MKEKLDKKERINILQALKRIFWSVDDREDISSLSEISVENNEDKELINTLQRSLKRIEARSKENEKLLKQTERDIEARNELKRRKLEERYSAKNNLATKNTQVKQQNSRKKVASKDEEEIQK